MSEVELKGGVTVLGVPSRGVEILGVAGSRVVGSVTTDKDGQFVVKGAGLDHVVARFVEPFVGCVSRPAPRPGEILALSIERADIVKLSGTFLPPVGVALDWVDLKLTPRIEAPPTIVLSDSGGLREAYWIRRLVQPSFEVRVLRGTWELRAGREIEAPMAVSRPVNLGIKRVTLEDGRCPAPRFLGFEFDVAGDLSVSIELDVS
jgi:hypothetical protein